MFSSLAKAAVEGSTTADWRRLRQRTAESFFVTTECEALDGLS
jgi:hypothetical protein